MEALSAEPGVRLTTRQQRFVQVYASCGNAAEAARRAGYSHKSARAIGHENLTKPDIRRAINQRIDELGMEAAEVTARLAAQARGQLPTKVTAGPGQDIEVFDMHRALETIARIRGQNGAVPTDEPLRIEGRDPRGR